MARRKLNPKIRQMNAWKKSLRRKGVEFSPRIKYESLKALAAKHGLSSGRASSSRRTSSASKKKTPRRNSKGQFVKGGGGSSRSKSKASKSARKALKSQLSSQTDGAALFGWTI